MAAQPAQPAQSAQEKKGSDDAYWTSPGVVKNGFSPILNVQVGTFVARKRLDRNGGTCFELFEIVSTPNSKQLSIVYTVNILKIILFDLTFETETANQIFFFFCFFLVFSLPLGHPI